MSIAGVARELLVRHLETWTPVSLHGARRATFVQAWSATADRAAAEAAVRVFAEFGDRLRGRRLAVAFVAPDASGLAGPLEDLRRSLGTPPELTVHTVTGGVDLVPAALTAAAVAGAPLLCWVDTDEPLPVKALATGRPAEVLLLSSPTAWADQRATLRAAGFELTAGVGLVDTAHEAERLLGFATSAAKRLEAFKDALWAVDEYAGVRYRDPHDPQGHLLDITLSPHPGPLRRELLSHLAGHGPRTVTDLRRFTLTETVYRASDTTGALTALLTAGSVIREPERGRLAGDVMIALASPAPG